MKIKMNHALLAVGAILTIAFVSKHFSKSQSGRAGGRVHPMSRAHLGRVWGTPIQNPGMQNNDYAPQMRGGAASPMSGEIGPMSPLTAKNLNPMIAHTPTNKLLRTANIGGLNAMHRLQGSYGLVNLRPDTIINYR
jgi:hypothetical protein